LDKNGETVGPTGLPLDKREREGFRDLVARSEISRMHTVNFAEDHSVEEIQTALRSVAQDQLDGEWVVAVHTETDSNHGYVGQAGDESECWQDREDMMEFRSAVADEFDGETIG
jgi:3,4-dihydroxy-2-butanone 4-phosphate synthase